MATLSVGSIEGLYSEQAAVMPPQSMHHHSL